MFEKSLRLAPGLLLWVLATCVSAEPWPGWRGPRGDGSSLESHVPIEWDGIAGKNVAWKAKIPGAGHSSPIVWQDRIFLTSCQSETKERLLVCVDRHTGAQRWQRTVFQAPLESIHGLNSYASGTPATDGTSVYVTFLRPDGTLVPAPNVGAARDITRGEVVVAAFDFEGELRWQVSVGDFISAHGFCSCPVLYQDLVIVNGDHDGDSYVVALDRTTGQERWRFERKHKTRSYVTPIIRDVAGRPQLVFSGSKRIVSLDPSNGRLQWYVEGPTEQFVASMVFDGELFFMTCGFPDHFVTAIRPDGQGDVTDTHVVWENSVAKCYVPSPVVVDDYLLVADDRGTASCFDTRTGDRHWRARLGSGFSASLVHANNRVYFIANDGTTKIVEPDREFRLLCENPLGERVSASPAISEGQLFIRGEESLFCIGHSTSGSHPSADQGTTDVEH